MNPTKGVPPLIVAQMDPDRSRDQCFWFLRCAKPATRKVEHPTLGWIPCCDDHIAWLEQDGTPKVGT